MGQKNYTKVLWKKSCSTLSVPATWLAMKKKKRFFENCKGFPPFNRQTIHTSRFAMTKRAMTNSQTDVDGGETEEKESVILLIAHRRTGNNMSVHRRPNRAIYS